MRGHAGVGPAGMKGIGMNIGQMALYSGLGIGAATAIGTFLGHESLEGENGEWTRGNSALSTFTQGGVMVGAVGAMGAHVITRSPVAIGVGTGILFGGLVGNVAGMGAASIID